MTDRQPDNERGSHTRVSRSTLLRGTAAAAIGAMAVPDLALSAGRATTPTKGGTLRAGFVGGGTAETLNPYIGVTPIDEARIQNLYDPLVVVNADLTRSPGLALSWAHNKDATVWTVKLRPGVTFHNGKTFGAEDVIWSIRQMAAKTSYALPFVSGIRVGELKALNKLTVRIPLKAADADLPGNFTYYNTWIVPKGQTSKDYKKPIGTGPFKAQTFTPGRQSVFAANPNYWVKGKPYVDSLKITSIDDNTARLNALLSGQIDAMAQLPTQQAKAHDATGDIQVLVAPSPQAMMFYMDTTKAPFSDPRVTLAMKLIADRKALVESAISGYGTVGNDIFGAGLPFYDKSLPQRVQDIDKAKSLLKAAGQSDLKVQLNTSTIFPGFVEAATLLAQQAKKAGVTINLKQVPPSSYYNPSLLYLKMPFAETQWPISSLKFFFLQALASDAPYNETHWKSASWNATLKKAIAEPNQAKAQSYWNQIQQAQYNRGGYLNWTNADWVDGLSKKVNGLKPSAAGVLGNYRFLDAWLTS